MAETMTVSSSQGRPAEWHDQRVITPANADKALADKNERWIGDTNTTDQVTKKKQVNTHLHI